MQGLVERLAAALSGRYTVDAEAGRGGMAFVYRAHDVRHDRPVAIKVIKPEIVQGLGPDRFLREIHVTANLSHPHILPLYDSGEAEGLLYYVMPFVEGESLRQRLAREGALPIDEALRIGREVAKALEYAHARGVVHRDIKPENILLLPGGEAVVADFGIALALNKAAGERLTDTGLAVGTPQYMSPEQAMGDRIIDARSDVYALGCVLYEMFAGEPPYTGPTPMAIVSRRLSEPVPALHVVRETVPEAVVQLLDVALARAAPDRCDAAQFARALDEARKTGGASLAPPAPRQPRPARRAFPWRLAAVAAVPVLAVATVLALRPRGGPERATETATRVAVFPFLYHGDEAHRSLEGGMVGLLSTALDGVGEVRTVDPSAVLGLVDRDGSEPVSPERARPMARELSAGRFVVGSIQEAGGRLTITASVWPTEAPGDATPDRRTVQGDPDQLFALVNYLTVQLLGVLGIEDSPRRIESMSTSSIVALNDYLRGEIALRRGDYDSASAALERAIEVDSTFALAWFRIAQTPNTAGVLQVDAARRALALGTRLSDRDRRLAQAHLAFLELRAKQAVQQYSDVLRDYPEDVDALFGLAEVKFHWGPMLGLDMREVPAAFARALYFEPRREGALWRSAWASALVGDVARVDSGVARMTELGLGGFMRPLFAAYLAIVRGDSAAERRAIAQLRPLDDILKYFAVNLLSTLPDLDPARHATERLLTDPTRPSEVRAFGFALLAYLELAGGRWHRAEQAITQAETIDPLFGLEHRAVLTMIAPVEPPPSDLDALRARLLAPPPEAPATGGGRNPFFTPHAMLRPEVRTYLAGALSARLGDTLAARRDAADLDQGDSSTATRTGTVFAHRIRGIVAARAGRPAEAVRELSQLGGAGTWEWAYGSPIFSASYERLLRADALIRLGREPEALNALEGVWMQQGLDVALRAPASLRRATLLERSGDPTAARAEYARVLDLWNAADSAFQPQVRAARDALARLTEDRPAPVAPAH